MLDISITTNIRDVTRSLTHFAQRRLPEITADACTALAHELREGLLRSMDEEIDRPSPFTKMGLVVVPAKPLRPVAKVYMRDAQAAYLEPLLPDSNKRQRLGNSRAIIAPVNQPKNAYGNLPKGAVARLKGRQNVFIGTVKSRGGKEISGVWERTAVTAKGKTRRKAARGSMWSTEHGRLKLLVRFQDPVQVRTNWDYTARARALVGRRFAPVFAAAMAKALR